MDKGTLFWVLYVVGFLLSGWAAWPVTNTRAFGASLFVFVLIGLLGWGLYGAAVR